MAGSGSRTGCLRDLDSAPSPSQTLLAAFTHGSRTAWCLCSSKTRRRTRNEGQQHPAHIQTESKKGAGTTLRRLSRTPFTLRPVRVRCAVQVAIQGASWQVTQAVIGAAAELVNLRSLSIQGGVLSTQPLQIHVLTGTHTRAHMRARTHTS